MAAGSPFFKSLPLENYGLEWVHGDAALAHPLDDGTAVMLENRAHGDPRLGTDGRRGRTACSRWLSTGRILPRTRWDRCCECRAIRCDGALRG